MRTTHLIGGILIMTSMVVVPAAQAFEGPGGGTRPQIQGPDRQPRMEGPRIGRDQNETSTEDRNNRRISTSSTSTRPHMGDDAAFAARLKEKGGDIKQLFQDRRKEISSKIQETRDEFKVKIDAMKAERASSTEARKTELKAKLETFKDAKKKEATSRIDTALGTINTKWIATFTASVDRAEVALDAITSRTDKAEAAGKDVSAVRTKISAAVTAIADARTAITTQTGKDYTLQVTSETTVKTDATNTRDQLKTDLTAVRKAVRAAIDATKAAAQALRAIPGVDKVEVGTTTTSTNQ